MRLNKTHKNEIVAALTHERFETKFNAVIRKLQTRAHRFHKKLLDPRVIAMYAQFSIEDRKYFFHESTCRGVPLCSALVTPCKSGAETLQKTIHGLWSHNTDIHIVVEPYPVPYSHWGGLRDIDKNRTASIVKEMNLIVADELNPLCLQVEAFVLEIKSFINQFTTYKKLQKEWPDISRYLSDDGYAQRKKGEGTALIKSGEQFSKFLLK